jgi:hypothetical protein
VCSGTPRADLLTIGSWPASCSNTKVTGTCVGTCPAPYNGSPEVKCLNGVWDVSVAGSCRNSTTGEFRAVNVTVGNMDPCWPCVGFFTKPRKCPTCIGLSQCPRCCGTPVAVTWLRTEDLNYPFGSQYDSCPRHLNTSFQSFVLDGIKELIRLGTTLAWALRSSSAQVLKCHSTCWQHMFCLQPTCCVMPPGCSTSTRCHWYSCDSCDTRHIVCCSHNMLPCQPADLAQA